MNITRRDLLKLLAAGGAVLSLPKLGRALVALAQTTPDLAVIKGDNPAKNVRAAIEVLGGIKRFVSKGDRVVIKPNMGLGNEPYKATTTEPKVMRALAEMVLGAGAKMVMVFDYPFHNPDIALEVCGIKKELEGLDDTFVYIIRNRNLFREVAIPNGKKLKKQHVAIDILEADTIINVPIAKSHGSAKVTFGMKNWMGVVENRGFWHIIDLNQAIADFATFIKPKLTVIDATRALVTGGPGGPGEIASLKTIVAGVDPVAVDSYALTLAKWQGKDYKPQDVPYIMKAAEMGVGSYEIDKLNILERAV